jgi:RNA polymerase sigma factor for flagellar operon FliA
VARLQQAADRLAQHLGQEPTAKDVADHLGLTPSEYHELTQDAQARYEASLEAGSTGEDRSLQDALPDETAHEAADRAMLKAQVTTLVERLSERERRVLSLYYEEELTQREIGQRLGLTEGRISQVLGQTIRLLRTQMEPAHEVRAMAA